MDTTRIVWGLVLGVGVIFFALIDSLILNFIIFAIIFYLAFNEAKRLFSLEKSNIILPALAFVLGTIAYKPLLFGALALILHLGYLVYKKEESLKPILIYLYPVLPILGLWQVYLEYGIFTLFWLIIMVVVCDSGAYFIGKLVGHTPFCKTSPNKTLEGVIGGILCCVFIGTIVGLFEYSFVKSLLVAFGVGVFAVLGDLLESYFKRVAGVKDSGELIPGHGGMLDRIDALIIASFVILGLL